MKVLVPAGTPLIEPFRQMIVAWDRPIAPRPKNRSLPQTFMNFTTHAHHANHPLE